MLDYHRRQAVDVLAQATSVTLTTGGIAGLQTSVLPCEAVELNLYILVRQTSDHLANIENNPECVGMTDAWELRGAAQRVPVSELPGLGLAKTPEAEWSAFILVRPTRLQIARPDGVGYAATIDIDESTLKGD